MRFRTSTNKPPYLNRRDQRRLLYLFGLLVLVLIGMRMAAKPETWNWMFAGSSRQKEEPSEKKTAADSRPPKRPSRLQPDEFRATTSPAEKTAEKGKAAKDGKRPRRANGKPKPAVAHSDVPLPSGLFPANMNDRELGITLDEWEAYVAVLSHAQHVPVDDLRGAARENVSFTRLRQTPEAFRGDVISVEGRLGSLREIPAGKVEHGLGQLYEAWIVTPESENEPYRVVFSELPDDLEPTDLFDNPPEVRATGYFFKVQKYETPADGADYRYNYAPLLLARRIERVEPQTSQVGGFQLAPYVIGFALIVGAVLAITMWRFTRGDKKFAKEHLRRFEESRHAEATDLNRHQAGESPEDFFARLSEDEKKAGDKG